MLILHGQLSIGRSTSRSRVRCNLSGGWRHRFAPPPICFRLLSRVAQQASRLSLVGVFVDSSVEWPPLSLAKRSGGFSSSSSRLFALSAASRRHASRTDQSSTMRLLVVVGLWPQIRSERPAQSAAAATGANLRLSASAATAPAIYCFAFVGAETERSEKQQVPRKRFPELGAGNAIVRPSVGSASRARVNLCGRRRATSRPLATIRLGGNSRRKAQRRRLQVAWRAKSIGTLLSNVAAAWL